MWQRAAIQNPKQSSAAAVALLLLIGWLPAQACPQQTGFQERWKLKPQESTDSFVIRDPSASAVQKPKPQGNLKPLSNPNGLTPIADTGKSQPIKPVTPTLDIAAIKNIDPNWEVPNVEVLDEERAEGDFVQSVFTLPGPSLGPDQTAAPSPDAGQIAEKLAAADSATADRDRLKSELDKDISFLDTLKVEDFFQVAVEPYRIYRSSEARITNLAASSASFGWTSMEWEPYLKREQSNGLTGCIQNHFLSGPRDVDLPPRLHDFILGYQHRATIGDRFSFDCAASVGVFSDFQGSVREGVRFPAHAVGIIHASHRADLVFGVDYLNRKDYQILPVIGVSWHDLNWTALRYDLVFPRPRIDFTIDDGQRIYLAGQLGGGTWDFEYPDGSGSVMNYRDFRLLLGREQRYLDGSRQSIEIGYVFGRELTLQDVPEAIEFRNALLIRLLSRY